MDQEVVSRLEKEGFDVTLEERILSVPIRVDDEGKPIAAGDEVAVMEGEKAAVVPLKPITRLFAGNRTPPSFVGEPPKEYLPFLLLIERTALDFCESTGQVPYDEEFEKLYRLLRKRPDGTAPHPIFSYLQAAVRLYMSLRDVSQAEFEAVVQKLSRSASRCSEGAASKNYIALLQQHL